MLRDGPSEEPDNNYDNYYDDGWGDDWYYDSWDDGYSTWVTEADQSAASPVRVRPSLFDAGNPNVAKVAPATPAVQNMAASDTRSSSWGIESFFGHGLRRCSQSKFRCRRLACVHTCQSWKTAFVHVRLRRLTYWRVHLHLC